MGVNPVVTLLGLGFWAECKEMIGIHPDMRLPTHYEAGGIRLCLSR